AKGLHRQEALLPILGRHSAPGGAARDDEVVAFTVGQRAEGGLQDAGALVNKDQFITHGVAIEVVHTLRWAGHRDRAVGVVEHQLAPRKRVAARRDRLGFDVVMPMRLLGPLILTDLAERLDGADARRRILMVEQGVDAAKALLAKELLSIE